MSITVSSFSLYPKAFSQEQVELFANADIVFCETHDRFTEVMDKLGIDIEGKRIISTIQSVGEDHFLDDYDALDIILNNINQNIVIVSDEGFPNITDPYAGVIALLVEKNIQVDITPNISAVMSATILSGIDGNAFVFGGILVRWEDYSDRLALLKNISLEMPTILLIVVDNLEKSKPLFDSISDTFGPDRMSTIMHNMGELTARTYRCKASELFSKHSKHFPDPFTLVIHPESML